MGSGILKFTVTKLFGEKGYYKFADNYDLINNYFVTRKSNREFKLKEPDFLLPPIPLAFDAYAHINWAHYHDTGRMHAELISKLIKEHLSEREINVLDWGCGPARIIRHLPSALESFDAKLHGSDYNERTIKWCSDSFRDIQFNKNTLTPPLCYEDDMFHCVYNLSVFTHLSLDMHKKWMDELSRVIKPGGILIATTQGEFFRHLLTGSECELFDKGDIVVRQFAEEGKKFFSAFHPEPFVRNEMLKDYEVLEHIKGNNEQDVWVARKCS